MARLPRTKIKGAYYHIMCRSLSEFNLFRDDSDKDQYLKRLSKRVLSLNITLVAFCLMDNHLHLILNGNNCDISNFMKSLNGSYARYYNRKYNRRGPVFADRFKSKIIDSLRYFLTAICYIHYNPYKLSDSKNKLPYYKYSSFTAYVESGESIIDTSIALNFLSNSTESFINLHRSYNNSPASDDLSFEYPEATFSEKQLNSFLSKDSSSPYLYVTNNHYLSKSISPSKLLTKLYHYFDIETTMPFTPNYIRAFYEARCLGTVLLRRLCGLTYKEIASQLGNTSLSNIYWLNEKGLELFKTSYNPSTLMNLVLS